MSIINFFGTKIKPLKVRGAGILNPEPTGIINQRISCIRQYDVNLWFYTKGDQVIAFDAGYIDFLHMEQEFAKINLDPSAIKTVFLTHADMDHAGGLSDGRLPLYPNAQIFLHEKEVALWTGQTKRFVFGPISFRNSISRQNDFTTLTDGEIVYLNEIKVEIIHTPGHTPGHSCYLVDDQVLISGDTMAINQNGGYGFFDFYNMDTKTNLESLQKLKKRFKNCPPEIICTGHSGYSQDKENYFAHIDQVATGSKKMPFDKRAPFDVFK